MSIQDDVKDRKGLGYTQFSSLSSHEMVFAKKQNLTFYQLLHQDCAAAAYVKSSNGLGALRGWLFMKEQLRWSISSRESIFVRPKMLNQGRGYQQG